MKAWQSTSFDEGGQSALPSGMRTASVQCGDDVYTWDADLLLPVAAPSRVYVRCPTHGLFCVAGLDEGGVRTGAGLKALIYDRLMLRPTQAIRLTSWGREVKDEDLLAACAVQTNAKLDMSLSLRRAPPCPLHRVRVDSTALKTREFAVDGSTTVLTLKQSILEAHCKGVHRWVDEAGQVTQVRGATLIASEATKPDPKTMTTAMRMGEEFVVEGAFEAGKSKGGLSVRQADTGLKCCVQDGCVAALAEALPPAKQRLYYGGRLLQDDQLLEACGVRHDERLFLEFESPCIPDSLRRVRDLGLPAKGKGGPSGEGKAKKKK